MPHINVGGIRLGYTVHGQGEPLLLLMGLGAPGAAWKDHLAAYAQRFRCIVLDNRGAGMSDRPDGPYTTAAMADDAAVVLDGLGVQSAMVVGLSMGGAIAQELALRHPQKVSRLVLVSTWSRCDAYLRELFVSFIQARRCHAEEDFNRLLQLWIWSPNHFRMRRDELIASRLPDPARMAETAFTAQCHACMSHDTLDRLAVISQPCLLTAGEADIFTPPRLSEVMLKRLPNARLERFPDLGHCHHWEDLGRFNRITSAFLSGDRFASR